MNLENTNLETSKTENRIDYQKYDARLEVSWKSEEEKEDNIDKRISRFEKETGDSNETKTKEEKIEKIKCKNEDLAGDVHPETGVPFEKKIVEVNGEKKEVVVPVFESKCDVKIPEEMYKEKDSVQFKLCNEALKQEIDNNPELRKQFSEDQLQQIADGETPDGYTWHHNEEPGKMQLVDTQTHAMTGHTGGRSIWGGGSDNR